jgi:hypothetical protein
MNIAANQAIYPQTATHMSYPNGAIIQNPMQQTASLVRHSDRKKNLTILLSCFLGILFSYGTKCSRPIDISIQSSWSSF